MGGVTRELRSELGPKAGPNRYAKPGFRLGEQGISPCGAGNSDVRSREFVGVGAGNS